MNTKRRQIHILLQMEFRIEFNQQGSILNRDKKKYGTFYVFKHPRIQKGRKDFVRTSGKSDAASCWSLSC